MAKFNFGGAGDVVALADATGEAVTAANPFPVSVAGSTGNTAVVGPTASGAALTVPPVTIGGRAATTAPTAVTDGQVVNAMFSKTGKQVVIATLRTMKSSQKTTITASTTETTIITAGAAGVFNDLYGLVLANSGASTTKVDIRDVTAGTIIATLEVPTLETRGFMLSADSGFSQTTAASAWTAQCTTSTSSLEVTAMFAVNT